MSPNNESKPSLDLVMHSCLGTVLAVAVAVLAFWPHAQALVG